MKKMLLVCVLSIIAHSVLLAQNLPFENVKLESNADYKAADTVVVKTADYLLSSPIKPNNIDRLKAVQFLMNWMEGTPDYTFTINDYPVKYFVNDVDLMGVYMASLAKTAVQTRSTDVKVLTIDATKTFLAYITNHANKARLTNDLKKLAEANTKGELQSFLKL